MKILEINIYGYGKLENTRITGLQDFQVFYGENEAGKSTIMSFIHSILFGFPTKQQAELRYEPKNSAKYGGQLTVLFSGRGKAVIERVKGKAAGDVSVMLEDGTYGGEELLQDLLSHIDKYLYQSIFSFNLHRLQNVHSIKSEDLGRFLFSAGAVGSDKLLIAENSLQKEMELLFKPNGKKPIINEKLQKLRDLHGELVKAAQQNGKYSDLLNEKEIIENSIADLSRENAILQKQINKLEEWKKLYPVVKKQAVIKQELKQYENLQFPVDGAERLEHLENKAQQYESRKKSLTARISATVSQLDGLSPAIDLLNSESAIMNASESLPLYEQLRQEQHQYKLQLEKLEQEVEALREKLHITVEEEDLLKLDTSIFMKEKITDAHSTQERLKIKKDDLDRRFNEEKAGLESLEQQLTDIKTQLLPDDQLEELKKRAARTEKQEDLQAGLAELQERLASRQNAYKQEVGRAAKEKKLFTMQRAAFTALFAAIIIVGISSSEWLLTAAGAIGALAVLISFRKSTASFRTEELGVEIEQLLKKEQILKDKLADLAKGEQPLLAEKLEKELQLREKYQLLHIKWEEQNGQYERVISAFEQWEKDAINHNKLLEKLGQELLLPDDIALKYLNDAFQLIEKLKTAYRDKQYITEQYKTASSSLEKIETRIKTLNDKFLKNSDLSIREAALMLRNKVKAEHEKRIQYDEKQGKLSELTEELQELETELAGIKDEEAKLLNLAKAATTEEFRRLAHDSERKERLSDELDTISRQLKITTITAEEIESFLLIEDIDAEIRNQTKRLGETEKEFAGLQSQLADVRHEINQLEDGESYANLLHTFALQKAELNEEAKKWAKYAIAKDLLAKTANHFKNDKLPKVLNHAEQFLGFLTEGNYIRILPQQQGQGFLVERSDGILFEANELSQATAEQVYVSLRLALATVLYEKLHFPILIDDSFVNFDYKRTKKVLELLQRVEGNQILFFTCHQHLLSSFDDKQVIQLREEARVRVWQQ
ncbi:hypothetical protein CU633_07730 [Bacillus sp. V3-13]|uniref:ATP-binding protein n=1 Tax=Bacillus sp. V3-13 TaxID=2053728 RepID=UPI000C7810D0|nr:AAA family ATPase [Bacillus sp. V3-13]PLR77987.1 hypothetical protein CU633_07730 [Bacillus sp. V3-13]